MCSTPKTKLSIDPKKPKYAVLLPSPWKVVYIIPPSPVLVTGEDVDAVGPLVPLSAAVVIVDGESTTYDPDTVLVGDIGATELDVVEEASWVDIMPDGGALSEGGIIGRMFPGSVGLGGARGSGVGI
jgi:hypothetical protein